MRVKQLSPTGDYTFGNSQLNFLANSPECVAQVVYTSLLLWLGEWYLDLTVGMPWVQGVLGKHNQATADVTVQDYILGVQGVTAIETYTSIAQTEQRKYLATSRIDTLYGPTDLDVTNQRDL
ncbi:MAG: hypothetical protein OEW15_11695 [Nitrospirota bacterium]|nr:hypothetical protein [Nitrospirota bacterium]